MSTKLLNLTAPLAMITSLALLSGCASSRVTEWNKYVGREPIVMTNALDRPARVIVYDFDVDTRSSAEDSERRFATNLARRLSTELVRRIREIGVPAEHAGAEGKASGAHRSDGDLLIRGTLVSVDPGNVLKRMLVGFGQGAVNLKSKVVAFRVRRGQAERISDAEVVAFGGKMPGMLLPMASGVAAGTVLANVALSGATNIGKESGPESVEGAARRTAIRIASLLRSDFEENGWLPAGTR